MENNETVMNEPTPPDKKVFILKEKIADMHKYGKKEVSTFPRRETRLADEIRSSMLTMYRLSIEIEKKYYKKTTLQELDVELEILQHLIRLASDKDYYHQRLPKKKNGETVRNDKGEVVYISISPPLAFHKYEVWSRMLREIGRLIGGYIKSTK